MRADPEPPEVDCRLDGVAALQGATVTSDMLVPLGLRALAGLRFVVDDESED